MDARLQAATPSDSAAPAAGSVVAVTRRLDTLPITRLHVAALAVCTLGLFTDIAEVALSNALAAIFLAPPHNMPRGASRCSSPPSSPVGRWAPHSSGSSVIASAAGAPFRPPWR